MLWITIAGLVSVASAAVSATAATATTPASAAATAAAAAVAAPATTATATEPASAAATPATPAVFARAGFVHGEGAAVMLLPVEGCDRGLGFLIVRHLDEPKPLAASGVPVVDDLRGKNLSMRAEQLLQLGAVNLVAQVADIQLLSHRPISYEWVTTRPLLRAVLSGP
jgi:hypothetical protein